MHRTVRRLVALAVTAALVGAACGDDDDTAATSATTAVVPFSAHLRAPCSGRGSVGWPCTAA